MNNKESVGKPPRHKGFLGHLPGFINDEDLGLGDVIKRVTSTVGIKPCDGCERRAAALNRWFAFSGRSKQTSI